MANAITLLRIALSPVFVILMVHSNNSPSFRFIAFAIFIIGALTDWADGFIARKTKTISKFGITADPLADRIFIGTTLITLYIMRILPLVFLVVVLGRDLTMAAGYPIIGKIDPNKVSVHWTGKVATATLFVALSLLVLSPRPHTGGRSGFDGYHFTRVTSFQTWGLWFFVLGMAMSIISACVYISRVITLLHEGKQEGSK